MVAAGEAMEEEEEEGRLLVRPGESPRSMMRGGSLFERGV